MKIITYHNRQWNWNTTKRAKLIAVLAWKGVLAFRIGPRIVWINY